MMQLDTNNWQLTLDPKWQYLKNDASVQKIQNAIQKLYPDVDIVVEVNHSDQHTPHEKNKIETDQTLARARKIILGSKDLTALIEALGVEKDAIEISLQKDSNQPSSLEENQHADQ